MGASDDGSAKIWVSPTWQCAHTLTGHTDCVIQASFSRHGKSVLTASHDDSIKIWSASTGHCIQTMPFACWTDEGDPMKTEYGFIYSMCGATFSPDAAYVLTISDVGDAKVWDASTGQCLTTLAVHSRIHSMAFAAKGSSILMAHFDKTAKLWSCSTGQCTQVF